MYNVAKSPVIICSYQEHLSLDGPCDDAGPAKTAQRTGDFAGSQGAPRDGP